MTRRAVVLLLLICARALAAGPPAKSDGEDRPGRFKTHPKPTFLHERDFSADPTLTARPSQLVVLELEPGPGSVENAYRYTLASGRYRVCIDGELTGLTVADANERTLARVDRTTGCRELEVPKGVYRFSVTHDGTAMTSGSRIAFASAPRPVRLIDCPGNDNGDFRKCTPRDGYVAMVSATYDAVVRAQLYGPFSCDGYSERLGQMPFKYDFTHSHSIDDYALIRLSEPVLDPADPTRGPHLLAGNTPLGLDVSHCPSDPAHPAADQISYGVYAGNVTDPSKNGLVSRSRTYPFDNLSLFMSDAPGIEYAGYGFQLVAYGRSGAALFLGSLFDSGDSNIDELRRNGEGDVALFTTPFRYLPAGGDTTPLDAGEVALFRECGYKGPATVFVQDQPSLAKWSSTFLPLDGTTRSVRVGPNTRAVLYPGAGFGGAAQTIEVATPCLASGTGSSLRIGDLASVLVNTTRACIGCDLSGGDLSGADLSGYVLSRARFDGADLSRAKLTNAVLDHASFANARLHGADLSNAELMGANLGGAFLNADLPGKTLSAAVLIGAHMKDVNLSSAQLDGADFTAASFYGTNPAGTGTCIPTASGFTPSCATASGASAVGAKFTSAYLAGVDFTSVHFTGPDFTYAVLAGANFTGASFAPRDGAARDGFFAAHLQGAQLGDVKAMQGTSFTDAYLDFTVGGNALFVQLDGSHTTFPGRKNPGRSVCVLASYASATTVPAANTTITCPDGHAGPCGQGTPGPFLNFRWASPHMADVATPPVWYATPPTYPSTSGAPQLCIVDDVDADW
ncbi:MAG: pentapeptide repeat-containing protein [Thermoanaerobaculia bacterium]